MSSADKLLELINEANLPPKVLTNINVTFGTVAIDTGADGRNTNLVITGVPVNGYRGDVTIRYTRLDLSDIVADTLRTNQTLSKAVVVGLVNQAYGMFLAEDDLEDFTIPPLDSSNITATISLTADVASVGFVGTVDLVLDYGNAFLDGVIYVRKLPTLVHPIPVTTLQSTRMLTWNLDFTSIADALAVTAAKGYTDWSTVQAAAGSFGLPSWPQGLITDNATSAIADANPAFDRVVIQTGILTNELQGDIYLHYNVIN